MLRNTPSKKTGSKLKFWLIVRSVLLFTGFSIYTLPGQTSQCPNLVLKGISQNATCSSPDGSLTIDVSGGTPPYSYKWSNGLSVEAVDGLSLGSSITVTARTRINITSYMYSSTNHANGSSLTGIPTGSYTMTVIDSDGCTKTSVFDVGQKQTQFTVDADIVNASCSGTSGAINLAVSGGIAPYQFNWSNGASLEYVSGVPAGIYEVTITDHNQCSQLFSYEIGIDSGEGNFQVEAEINNASCIDNDGKISLSIPTSGIYTYRWSNDATTKDLSNLSGGNYSVIITNEAGCFIEQTYNVNINPGPSKPTITQESDTLLASGDGYYQWYKNGAIILNANKSRIVIEETDNYYVLITNDEGCSATSDTYYADYTQQFNQLEDIYQTNVLQVDVYPNPVQSKFNIKIKTYQPSVCTIELYNLQGNPIYSGSFLERKTQLFEQEMDISHLPSGLYIIKIKVGNELVTRSLIKE